MARPEWKPSKAQLDAIYELAKGGATDEDIIKVLGISKATFYKHKINFFEQLKKGREEGTPLIVDQVVNALLKKCLGYTYQETTQEHKYIYDDEGKITGSELVVTKIVEKEVQPSDQAIFYYLGNRASDKWRSVNYKTEIDIGDNAKEYFKEIAAEIRKSDTNSD